MKRKNVASRKLLCATLLGIFCVTSAIGFMPVAQANPYHVQYKVIQSFTGIVTKVLSNQKFNVRINDKIYNVYTTHGIPRNLHKGSVVRVSGQRVGHNDIRYANVIVMQNR